MHDFDAIATWLLVVMTTSVVLMSTFALVDRWLSERREARTQRLRRAQAALLESYLAGRNSLDSLLAGLRRHPQVARGVLLQQAGSRPREQRAQLQAIYAALGLQAMDLSQLRQRSPQTRASAATRLGFLGDASATPALRLLLDDADLDARFAAAQALAESGDADAAPLILSAVVLRGEWPVRRATEILMALGVAVVPSLRRFLQGTSAQGTPGDVVAINVLGLLDARQALPELLRCIRHDNLELRVASAKALGAMGDRQATAALVAALDAPEWEMRSMSAKALGRLRDPHAIDALRLGLADPAWWVRYNAAQALHEIGGEGIAVLEAASREHPDRFARDISRQMLEERKLPRQAGETTWA
jgi:HEAT repeat protein